MKKRFERQKRNLTTIGLPYLRLLVTIAAIAPGRGFSATLTLEQFLAQVIGNNKQLKASQLIEDAAPEKSSDADLVYAPNLFAHVQTATDKKEVQPVAQRGHETLNLSGQLGVSKLTSTGTALKLYYGLSRTQIMGTSPQFLPEPEWKEASPTLEISQPLWKNALGTDVEKSVKIQKTQSAVIQLTETLKRKITLAEAEGLYWRLVLARESLRVAKDNLDRAKKIIDWTRRRVGKELADEADLLQAESLGELRQIEVTMAIDEERSAAFALNTIRGTESAAVPEELVKLTPDLLNGLPISKSKRDREDVIAAEKTAEMASLAADLANSKYQPTLDGFALGTLNGRDPNSYADANSTALKGRHATYAFGVKFSTILGGSSFSTLKSSVAKEREASSLTAARRRYENDREWTDLNFKLQESRSRLNLTQKIETTQLKKLNAERLRQSRGRSTMFQVMQAETDYAASQLNVIRNKAEILGVVARLKTFGGEG